MTDQPSPDPARQRAEDVAKKVTRDIWTTDCKHVPAIGLRDKMGSCLSCLESKIADALTAYATAQVEAAIQADRAKYGNCASIAAELREARRETWKEAAILLADHFGISPLEPHTGSCELAVVTECRRRAQAGA